MTKGLAILLSLIMLALGGAAVMAGMKEAGSFDQAFAAIEARIKQLKKRGPSAMSFDVSSGREKGREEGNTVKFELPLDEKGLGAATTSKRCFGVELICKARIVGPQGLYKVSVKTDAGSKYLFEELAANQDVDFKLQTNSGFSSTEFAIDVVSLKLPAPAEPVLIAMDYDF